VTSKASDTPRRTGRRPGPNQTRPAILRAARAAFADRGYDAVSIRSVARDAGVDPALVHRFYGSKEALFIAAMELPVAPSTLVAGVLSRASTTSASASCARSSSSSTGPRPSRRSSP